MRNRLIVINHGKVVVDSALDDVISKMSPYRILVLDLKELPSDLGSDRAEIIKILLGE